MFTIDDIRGQFSIEGPIKVMKCHNDAPVGEENEICYTQDTGTAYQIPSELCNTNITYMYSDGYFLVIELECEEE